MIRCYCAECEAERHEQNEELIAEAEAKENEMNGFKQHIPGFVSVDTPPQRVPFKTTEDLLNIDTVVRFSKDPKFSHFAISDNCLMAIYDEGHKWWVVGYLDDPDTVLLPQWEMPK